MCRIAFSFAAVLLLSSTGLAETLAPACFPGTVTDYISLGETGCSIGDKVFSDFELGTIGFGSTEINPDTVLLTPFSGLFEAGLTAHLSGVSAAAGQVFESSLSYLVTVQPGGNPITSKQASMSGSSVEFDGAVVLVEETCSDFIFSGFCFDQPLGNLALFDIGVDAVTFGSINFAAPVTRLGIWQDIVVDGGLSGSAALGSVTNRLTEVPEPATAPLTGAVLAGLAWLGWRRRG